MMSPRNPYPRMGRLHSGDITSTKVPYESHSVDYVVDVDYNPHHYGKDDALLIFSERDRSRGEERSCSSYNGGAATEGNC